jgi:transcriptional regulator with XRE-family HTH domain
VGSELVGAGNAVRQLRLECGLTLPELAVRLGWDKGLLSKYETDRLALSLSTIVAIAAALKRTPEAIVFECLKEVSPGLSDSKTGRLMESIIDRLSGMA